MLLYYGSRVDHMLKIQYMYRTMARRDAANTTRPKIRVGKIHTLSKEKYQIKPSFGTFSKSFT